MSTNNDNSIIWQAIAEGRMDDAKKALALKVKRPPATSWFDIFKKKQPVTIDDVDVILSLALDIISPNPGAIDDTHTFSIDNKGSEAFAGLVD